MEYVRVQRKNISTNKKDIVRVCISEDYKEHSKCKYYLSIEDLQDFIINNTLLDSEHIFTKLIG